jgi:hypothetical protein
MLRFLYKHMHLRIQESFQTVVYVTIIYIPFTILEVVKLFDMCQYVNHLTCCNFNAIN